MKADTSKHLFQQDHYLDVGLQIRRISSVGRALSLQVQGRRFEPTIRCILVAPAGAPKVVPRESSILLKIQILFAKHINCHLLDLLTVKSNTI